MHLETLDDPGNLRSRFSKQCRTDKAVFKAMNVKLSPHKRLEQLLILFIEEAKALVSPFPIVCRLGDLLQILDARRTIREGRDELQVPAIGGLHQPGQNRQAID